MLRIFASTYFALILLWSNPCFGSFMDVEIQGNCVVRCSGLYPDLDGINKDGEKKSCVEGCSSLVECSSQQQMQDVEGCHMEMLTKCNTSCENAFDHSNDEYACKMGCAYGIKDRQADISELAPKMLIPGDIMGIDSIGQQVFRHMKSLFGDFESAPAGEETEVGGRFVVKVISGPGFKQVDISPSGPILESRIPFGFLFNRGFPSVFANNFDLNDVEVADGPIEVEKLQLDGNDWRQLLTDVDIEAKTEKPAHRLFYTDVFVRHVPPLMSFCLLFLSILLVAWMCLVSPAKKSARNAALAKANLLKQSEAQFVVAISGSGKQALPMDLPPAYDDATTMRVNLDSVNGSEQSKKEDASPA